MRNLSLFIFLCFAGVLHGQVWQRYYNGDRAFALEVLPNGSLIAAGSGQSNAYFLHADITGAPLTEHYYGAIDTIESAQVLLPSGSGWWLWGSSNMGQVAGWQIQGNGLFQQFVPALAPATLYDGATQPDGSMLLCGATSGSALDRVWTAALDAAGNMLWSRTDSIGVSAGGNAILPLANGGAIVAGTYIRSGPLPDFDFFLQKTDAAGNITASHIFEWPGQQRVTDLLPIPNGEFWVVGSIQDPGDASLLEEDVWLAKIAENGDVIEKRHIALSGFQIPHSALILPNGNIALAGETRTTANGSRDAFLAIIQPNGALVLLKTYGGIKGDIFWDLALLPDGGFALAGQSASFGDGNLHTWLLRTDELGDVWAQTLYGRLLHDTSENCQPDANEMPLSQWLVTAAGTPGVFYTTTDDNGYYQMPIDTGTWYISVLPFASAWQPCMDSVKTVIETNADSVLLHFSVQSGYDCPALAVDIGIPFLRRCFENTYAVSYNNYGTSTAYAAQIAVIPDAYLTVTGSAWPYTMSGDTLLFELGDVPALASGLLSFTAFLDCDSTLLGQMHCTVAHIRPDSLCSTIDPGWDGASLNVEGYCAGDSVVLTITNTGIGGMQNPVEYVITEDQIIFKMAALQLAAGESTTIVVYPNGATVVLTVPQTPGHPGNSDPMLVVEGCGGTPFSTGYAYQFPTNDGDWATDIDCRPNIGSYDPNDKTAMPVGVSDAHVIRAGTAIEYLIRFQNTGTDTAFRVEIRDTLDPNLVVESCIPGASSHAYRYEVMGNGVMRFIFDPIALPDSATHALASQGFVKYRILTKKNLLAGSKILNKAAIYFDFNEGIHTNTVFHTIGQPEEYLLTDVKTVHHSSTIQLRAWPNPFREKTLIQWTTLDPTQPCLLRLLDAQGRVVFEKNTTENSFLLENSTFNTTVLWIQVFQQHQLLASGTLIQSN